MAFAIGALYAATEVVGVGQIERVLRTAGFRVIGKRRIIQTDIVVLQKRVVECGAQVSNGIVGFRFHSVVGCRKTGP